MDKVSLEITFIEAQGEIAQIFVEGFNGAIQQMQGLHPTSGISLLNPFKIVVDGKIVHEHV